MIGRLFFFLGATVGAWVVLAVVSRMLWGDAVAADSAVAAVLCLVPTIITLIWSELALTWQPEYQVGAVMGGTGVRMFIVAGVAFALFQNVEFLRREGSTFWTWVLTFYMLTLTLEVAVLLWAQAKIQARLAKKAEAPGETPAAVTAE